MRSIIWKSWIIILGLLVSQLVHSQVRVACIGNSITYGYGLSSPSTQSYPSILQGLLGSCYEVSNFGVSSRTMLKNGDLPYWNESEYTQALNLLPDIVIIMLGTNDSKPYNWIPYEDEFKDDYKDMIKSFRDLSSNPKIWVCLILPSYNSNCIISDSTIKNEVNPKIKEVATEECLSLIDMYTAMENNESMFQSDGIHPNATGTHEMANCIYNIMLQDTLRIHMEGDILIAPEAAGYQWYYNRQLISELEGGLSRELEVDSIGIYQVGNQLTSGTQTTILSEEFNYEQSTTVDLSQNLIHLYPNPCKDCITVQFSNAINKQYEFNIYKSDSQLVYSAVATKDSDRQLVNLQSFSSGFYIYQLSTKNKIVESGKIVINR